MEHNIIIAHLSDRVLAFNQKTRINDKTRGWRTHCSCGFIVITKRNSIKLHKSKVEAHKESN